MPPLRATRSISLPITLASVGVVLSIVLIVAWVTVVLKNTALTQQVVANLWLMVTGIVSLSTITGVLVWFGVFLAREILEGRRQTSFIDSVTHELKSPLASLKLGLETLGRAGLSEPQRTELRGMMMEDVDRLSAFIEGILAASRLEHEERGHPAETIDLGAMAQRVADAVARRYHLEDGAVRVDVTDGIELRSDPVALETILKNLLDNAIKYSSDRPEIAVRARRMTNERVRIDVEDRGIGIQSKHLKRIFDRFYRAPGQAVRERRGTGLGLYVVSSLVRSLGGRISAHSDGAGAGTTISIVLPTPRARRAA